MKKIIAIVDDEPDIRELVSVNLERIGFETEEFRDSKALFKYLEYKKPDLIILDLMLPDEDGTEICKKLKGNDRTSAIPIIMLTARGDESDRILGLEIGADDYVTKPFSPKELNARVKAVLRRGSEKQEQESIKTGVIEIDMNRHAASIKGRDLDLTATEFRILAMLAQKPGWVFSREQILKRLWGNDKSVTDRTVDVHIRHLREKMGKHKDLVCNMRGVGYKLEI